MFAKLYIKRKLQKKLSDYICVFLVILISMVLINIPGIFVDSINKGESIRNYEKTGGYDMVLHGAEESDLPYFREVKGITTVCEKDGVYIKVDPSVDREDTMNHISHLATVHHLNVSVVQYHYSDSAPSQLIFLANAVSVAFSAVGVISIYFAYILMFKSRYNEMKTLIQLGIKKRDLCRTLLIEISFLYALALVLSLCISNAAVKLLIEVYFRPSDNYVMMVYAYSVKSFVILLLCSCLAVLVAFALSWKKIVSGLYGEYFEAEKYYCRQIFCDIECKNISPEKLVAATALLRKTEHTIPCGIVAVVTILLSTFLFHFTGILSSDYSNRDLTIQSSSSQRYSHADEINEAYAKLSALPSIKNVELRVDDTGYVANIDSEKNLYRIYNVIDHVKYFYVNLISLDEQSNRKLGLNEALVPDDTDLSIFPDNMLALFSIQDFNDSEQEKEKTELNVVGTVKQQNRSNFLSVYVSNETFSEITGHEPVPRIAYVQLEEGCDINEVLNDISNLFASSALFQITNNYSIRQEQQNNDRVIGGIIFLMSFIIALCGLLLIYVFSSFIAIASADGNHKLIRLGIERKSMVYATTSAAAIRAIISILFGMLLSCLATALLSYAVSLTAPFQIGIVLYDIFLLFAVILVHLTPILLSVKKMLKNGGTKE